MNLDELKEAIEVLRDKHTYSLTPILWKKALSVLLAHAEKTLPPQGAGEGNINQIMQALPDKGLITNQEIKAVEDDRPAFLRKIMD